MRFYVFHILNDFKIAKSNLSLESNIELLGLRNISQETDCYQTLVLLSSHSSNQRVINYIRSKNVLIPIYIIGKESNYLNGINGYIEYSQLKWLYLKELFKTYPQQFIWNYVFKFDNFNRNSLACC